MRSFLLIDILETIIGILGLYYGFITSSPGIYFAGFGAVLVGFPLTELALKHKSIFTHEKRST